MTRKSPFVALLRSAGLPALAIIFMAFFGYYAVLGPNGVLAMPEYQREIDVKKAELARLDKQRAEMKNRVTLLDPKRANPDMVEEQVTKDLNVAHPDDVIVILK